MTYLTMYLAAFDPHGAINNGKGIVVGLLFLAVGLKLIPAVFGRLMGAISAVVIGAVAYMAVAMNLLPDVANWLQSIGLG